MKIGIDIGATKIESVILKKNGDEIERSRVPCPKSYKKIIKDIQLKNFKIENSHKKTIVSLISKNETIIADFNNKNSNNLKNIQNEKRRSQAYLRSY